MPETCVQHGYTITEQLTIEPVTPVQNLEGEVSCSAVLNPSQKLFKKICL
jgi:hypothetical protein